MERFHCLCHTFLCVNTLFVCVCAYVGWVGVGGLASNVDCTGMFIEYMYAHLHNICMCLLLYYALIYYSLKVYTV